MTIYPGAHRGSRESERVEHVSATERVYHLRHFWRLGGCFVWVTTVRVRAARPIHIIGEHIG